MPAARRSGRSNSSLRSSIIEIVVDSPPGSTARRPRQLPGVRTSTAPPEGAQRFQVQRRRPCNASTPTRAARGRPSPSGRIYHPRSASLVSRLSIRGRAWPPRAPADLWPGCRRPRLVVASTMALAITAGWSLLKMPEPTNTPGAELHDEGGVGGRGDAAGAEHRHRQSCRSRRPPAPGRWATAAAWPVASSGRVGLGDLADVAGIERRWRTASTMLPVPGLALGADHRRHPADATQASPRFVARTKGTVKPTCRCGGPRPPGEHLALVDVVDAERLGDLGLGEVADAGLGHHRDGHRP